MTYTSFRGKPLVIKSKNGFHPHPHHLSGDKRNEILDQAHKMLSTIRLITSGCPRCSRMLNEWFEGERQREFVVEEFAKELNGEGI